MGICSGGRQTGLATVGCPHHLEENPEVMGPCRKLIVRVLEGQGASSARRFSSNTALSM